MNIKKNMIITGGSSGIGLAIVKKFLNNNYFVVNLDIIDNNLKDDNYLFIECDMKKEATISKAFQIVSKKTPCVHNMVINAGVHLSADIENTSTSDLLNVLGINLLGAWWSIKYFLPLMKDFGGSIITIGSDQSSIARPNSAAYGMTKAALLQLTKSTALDYAKYNIRANCLGVGIVDTPLFRKAINKYSQKTGIPLNEIEQSEALEQPLQRIGKPEEIAELAYFLTLPQATYITGALLPIDGGYIAK